MSKVTIITTNATEPLVIDTKARTWGELKSELQRVHKLNMDNMFAMIQSNKNTLEVDESLLPSLDEYVLFMFAVQVKSGAPRKGESVEAYNKRRREEAAAKKKQAAGKNTSTNKTSGAPANAGKDEALAVVEDTKQLILKNLTDIRSKADDFEKECLFSLNRIEQAIEKIKTGNIKDGMEILREEHTRLKIMVYKSRRYN